MFMKARTAAYAAAITLGVSTSVLAATATTNLTVTATVADNCLVSATALAFSTLDPSATTNETTPGAIEVICTSAKVGVTVALGAGGNETGGQRRMDDGFGNLVPYNLHSDSAHTSPVAVDGNIFTGNITAATPTSIDVYGQVPTGNYIAGAYSDVVLITVTY